jgi:inner membrane protein YhjD
VERLRSLLRRFDEFQQRQPWLGFPVAVLKKFGDDHAGSHAALLAYYGFFSIFPLLLALVTVAGFVLRGDQDLQLRILDSALAGFPVVGSALRENVGSITGSVSALVIGVVGALWSGMAVIGAGQFAMDEIWDVPRTSRAPFLRRHLRGFVMLLVLGTFVVAGALVAALSASLGGTPLVTVAGIAASALLNTVVFAAAFRILTVEDVSRSAVVPGAVVAGIGWTALQALGGYLVEEKIRGAGEVYGFFAVVIGLLFWIYVGAQLTLVSAEINVVRARGLWPRSVLPPPSRSEDRRALAREAEQTEVHPSEEITVTFRDERSGSARPGVPKGPSG